MLTKTAFHAKHLELDSTPGSTAFLTFNGHAFDIFDPDTWVFDIEDIAQALSTTCRFGGHVNFYSVAEHSVRVANMLKEWGFDASTQLIGLLHDAVEAYIGDIVRPIKKHADLGGESVMDLEKSMEYCLFQAYDLLGYGFNQQWELAKKADIAVLELERAERPAPGRSLSPLVAHRMFLNRFTTLSEQIG